MTQAKKWHERQSSPATGNISARPGRSAWGVLPSSRRMATIPYLCHFNESILGPQYAFSRHRGIYRSDVVQTTTNPGTGADLLPSLSPPVPGKRTRREDHALLIVRDEFRSGYSLIGLLASRARLRFTGHQRS
uniref:Uncharacterized protein n=1 Tax=Solibacter usitatus (strain Ellin6076) TaxID=234267 RepID=Q01ND3_SOLUE